jgi:HD-GYP domain-containing protein (c-di-GMP phosphodiesterase class II)
MGHEKAFHILFTCAGTQFDPHIVAVFLKLPREKLASQSLLGEDRVQVEESETSEAVEAG